MLAIIVAALVVPAAGMANQEAMQDAVREADLHCLAQNIYFEARGEPLEGKLAVAHVVLNRMADDRFPGQACSVVRQGGEKRRHRCQFSWWCDGRSDRPGDAVAWEESKVIAVLIKAGLIPDPTGGALWYHARYVRPDWADRLMPNARIGQHIFYIDKPTQIATAE